MIEQGRGGALALGAGDAKGVFAKGGEEYFCLRGQTVNDLFGVEYGNAGAFEDIIKAVEINALRFGVPELTVWIGRYVNFLGICQRQWHVGIKGTDVIEGGNTLSAHAPDDDFFILDK